MTAEIIKFPKPFKETYSSDPVPVGDVLRHAQFKDLKDVIVIGIEKETDRAYLATAEVDMGKIIFLLEKAKQILINQI